jgi:hypothetical protein
MGKTFEFGAAENSTEVSRKYNDALIAKIIALILRFESKIMDSKEYAYILEKAKNG